MGSCGRPVKFEVGNSCGEHGASFTFAQVSPGRLSHKSRANGKCVSFDERPRSAPTGRAFLAGTPWPRNELHDAPWHGRATYSQDSCEVRLASSPASYRKYPKTDRVKRGAKMR